MEKEKLEKIKRLIIVVDMINGFAKEGALADSYIMNIVPAIKEILENLKEDEEVVFIIDRHKKGSREFQRYPEHCLENTYESEVIDELKEYVNENLTYYKNSTSTMFATNFMSDLEKMKMLETVIAVGCCTDICVANLVVPLQNYFDEINKETEIIVPINSVETFDAPFHKRDESNKFGLQVIESAGVTLVDNVRKRMR